MNSLRDFADSLSGDLPPMAGRLLNAYRALWLALAIAAVSVLAFSLVDDGTDPAIVGLRTAKGAVLLAVSAILFRRRQRNMVAAMLSLAFLLWTITGSFNFSAVDMSWWQATLDRLRFLLFALALLLFPDGRWSPPWTRHVAGACLAVCAIGIAEALGLLPTALFLPLGITCVIAAITALLHRFQQLDDTAEKQQLKWVAFGLTSGVALILCARAGYALEKNHMWPHAGAVLEALFQTGIVVVAFGFLISLLRYRLYDAEAVISRSTAYALLTVTLVAIFAGTESFIEMLGQRYFGAGIGNVSGAMAAAVAAVMLTPLHGRISAWAEHIFQRDLVALRERLPEMLAELAGCPSSGRIGLAVLPHIEAAVHASHAALFVDGRVTAAHRIARSEARQWAGAHRIGDATASIACDRDLMFPLRLPLCGPFGGLRGWLLLGTRRDGFFYGRDEIEALGSILPPLRQTLLAAREREKEKARKVRTMRSFTRAVRLLSKRLEALESTGPSPALQCGRGAGPPAPEASATSNSDAEPGLYGSPS